MSNNGPEIFVIFRQLHQLRGFGTLWRAVTSGLVDYVTARERFGGFMPGCPRPGKAGKRQTYFQYLMDLVDADLASPDTGTVDMIKPEDSTGEKIHLPSQVAVLSQD